jgi:signal transduction histidine kinase
MVRNPGVRPVETIEIDNVDRRGLAERRTSRRRAPRDGRDATAFYEHRLRGMASELIQTEERERKRLAADLHDGLSQLIALAQMKLAGLTRTASVDERLGKPLEEVRKVIEEANRSVRSMTCQLSPPFLNEAGLEPTLRWLCEDIQARYGLAIRFEDDGKPQPSGEKTRAVLYRSVRELLINTAKHARSTLVRVVVGHDKHALCIRVEDDGVGLDPARATSKGSGLYYIRERLGFLGGSMRVESGPAKGTKIHLRVPLEPELAA